MSETIPNDFYQALHDCKAGKTVDMQTALNKKPTMSEQSDTPIIESYMPPSMCESCTFRTMLRNDNNRLTEELTAARAEIEILNEKLSQHKQSLASTDIHNNEIAVKLEQVTEQRDKALSQLESQIEETQLNAENDRQTREQRDRLAELLEKSLKYIHTCPFKANCIEALQSLTTNANMEARRE